MSEPQKAVRRVYNDMIASDLGTKHLWNRSSTHSGQPSTAFTTVPLTGDIIG